MKFVLFVEGETEDLVLNRFLEKWLNAKPRLSANVGIKMVSFEGWADMVAGIDRKALRYLNDPRNRNDIIAVLALLDLYGPTFYPQGKTTVEERYAWAKNNLEQKVGHPKFRQYFAVHETEAWLLSHPAIFPSEIRPSLAGKTQRPETVNFDEPPAKLLDRLYTSKTGRHYKKVTQGEDLFAKLDPEMAYEKCPSLKQMLDDMLALAKEAGQ